MADPVVEFVADWIEENVTPEIAVDEVDQETVQEHLTMLLAEAQDEGISEEDIDESGLDVPSLIEAALKKGSADEADGDEEEEE
ncbi:MAG TPA: hypothetical protein VM900_06435 [Sphingomonas sp.]|nr:hypothetical protein [Sphingomonas sp.]